MRLASALVYIPEQNRPSKPLPFLVEIPNDTNERDSKLRKLFIEFAHNDVDENTVEICNISNDFGDIAVSTFDEVYLFLTYVDGDVR